MKNNNFNLLFTLKNIKNNYQELNYVDYALNKGELYKIYQAQINRDKEFFINFWKYKIKNKYFELEYPFDSDILTQAIDSVKAGDIGRAIFMTDKLNQYPWILIQFTDMANAIITNKGVYVLANPWLNSVKNHIMDVIEYYINKIEKNLIFFKNIEFGFSLHNTRPAHFFFDNLGSTYDLIKYKKIENSPIFYLSQDWNIDETNSLVYIFPNGVYGESIRMTDTLFLQNIYNEALSCTNFNIKKLNIEYDLKIWIGLAGEKRGWLEQIDGLTQILSILTNYFENIKIYFDGMTSYENIKMEFKDNSLLYNMFLESISKRKLKIDIECLIGKNYKEKINYASNVDIVIADVGTTTIACCEISKKPVVGFFTSKPAGYTSRCILHKYLDIPCRFVNQNYVLPVGDTRWDILKSFHIPWEHIYNLTAELLEEVKGIKMHRLDVPPVELVAKQYDLEQELGIKIPIESIALFDKVKQELNKISNEQKSNKELLESIALFDEVKQELNKISNEQKSNKELLESIALFDEVKQELNKISNEQKSNKELLTQIISGNIILQDYVNKKNLQDQSIINQNQNLITELLYCKEQNSILEQKLAPKAKSRIRNQLSYKLGQAMIENSKSLWGYIRMPYVLSYIKEQHKKEQIAYNQKIKTDPNAKLPPLESYPDYKEALKEKECLTYKLGEAMIEADKNPLKLGYLTIWFKCKKIQRECRNR